MAVQQVDRHFCDEIVGWHLVVWTRHTPLIRAMKGEPLQQQDQIALNMLQEIWQKACVKAFHNFDHLAQ